MGGVDQAAAGAEQDRLDHHLDPGPAGEVGDEQVGAPVGVDHDPGRAGALQRLDGQVDQRPAGRGQQRLGGDAGQRQQPGPGPGGQAEPDHRGGASGAIPDHPGPAPSPPSSRSTAAVSGAEQGLGLQDQGRQVEPPGLEGRGRAGGGPAEDQGPPCPWLVGRGLEGHLGQLPQSHEDRPAQPGPGPDLVQVVDQVEEPRPPRRLAPPRPPAQVGNDRPPEAGQEPGHPTRLRPADTGPGRGDPGPPADPGNRLEDQERPGAGAGELGDRDLGAVAQEEEHAVSCCGVRRPGW